jgi:hypothetical protein
MLAAVTPVHVHFRPLRYVPVLIDLRVGQTCLCESYRGISTMRRRAAKVCAIAVSISACTATAFADTDTCAASLQLQEILVTAQKRAENPFDESARWPAFSWRTALDYALAQEASVYASASTGFKGAAFNGGFSARTRPKPVSNSGRSDPRRCWLMRPT